MGHFTYQQGRLKAEETVDSKTLTQRPLEVESAESQSLGRLISYLEFRGGDEEVGGG